MGSSPIGLVGVGLLGRALAERMLAAGQALLAYDVNAAQLTNLQAAVSLDEIAASCQTIVLCLPDSQVVRSVVEQWGDELRRGTLLIDATTGDPEDAATLAARLRERGIGYVEAAIAGSSEQVRRGEAVVLVGGQPADVALAENLLASWSPVRYVLGTSGSGARMKLVVNLVLGLNRAALAEGLSLAEACGIGAAAALEVLQATPASSAVMSTKGPKMVARDFTPQARLSQHLKDVRLIRELARRHGATVPLSEAHERLLEKAVALGLGDADNSAVLGVFLPDSLRGPPRARALQ